MVLVLGVELVGVRVELELLERTEEEGEATIATRVLSMLVGDGRVRLARQWRYALAGWSLAGSSK